MLDKDQQLFNRALSDQRFYSKSKDIRVKILQGNQEIMNMVQHDLCRILRDRVATPTQKLLAMKFAKDSLETFNDAYISQFQETVLPIIEKIAMYKKESQDDDKGKFYFSDKPNAQMSLIGNSFIRLTLENIWVWSKWFPIDPDTQTVSPYKICLMRLIHQGVKFPKIEYYDFESVSKHMPDLQVPIIILKQCKTLIVRDLEKNQAGSSLKLLSHRMSHDIRTELKKIETKDVFYAQIFHRLCKKIHGQPDDFQNEQRSPHTFETRNLSRSLNEMDQVSLSANSPDKTSYKQLLQEVKNLKFELQKVKEDNKEMKDQMSILTCQSQLQQTLPYFHSTSKLPTPSSLMQTNDMFNNQNKGSKIIQQSISESQNYQSGFSYQDVSFNDQKIKPQSNIQHSVTASIDQQFRQSQISNLKLNLNPSSCSSTSQMIQRRKSEYTPSQSQQETQRDKIIRTNEEINSRIQQAQATQFLIQSSKLRLSQIQNKNINKNNFRQQ